MVSSYDNLRGLDGPVPVYTAFHGLLQTRFRDWDRGIGEWSGGLRARFARRTGECARPHMERWSCGEVKTFLKDAGAHQDHQDLIIGDASVFVHCVQTVSTPRTFF